MKKGILSFTVVLAFAIVNVLGCFSAAAYGGIGNTHVALSTTVKTAVVDDDFEDRTVDVTMDKDTTSYAKPLVGNAKSVFKRETNGNMYMQTTEKDVMLCTKSANNEYGLDSDRLAISFDILNPEVFTNVEGNTYADLYVGGTKIFRMYAKEKNGGTKGLEVKYFSSKNEKNFKYGSGTTYWTQKHTSGNYWNHVELVLKRIKNAEGKYTVELERLNSNGVEFNLSDGPYQDGNPDLWNVDWWTKRTDASKFIGLGMSSKSFALDNVLICAPGECARIAPRVSTSFAPAKRFFIDDNFNDRTDNINASDYSYKVLDCTNISVGGEGNDKYATITGTNGYVRLMKQANAVDSDKLALHFKYKLASGGYVNLNFCSPKVLSFAKNAITLTGATSTDDVTLLKNPAVSADGWTYVDLVFERKAAESGDKIMYLTKLAVNGNTVDIGSESQVKADAIKWWDAASFGYYAYNFQLVTKGTCVDDILLYEPAETATGFEIANFNNGTITIRNANAAALDLTGSKLIVAAYDKGDNLLGAAVKEIDANLASGESTSVSIAGVTAPTGTAYYKFFAWNNLNDMVPLFTQAEVTAK